MYIVSHMSNQIPPSSICPCDSIPCMIPFHACFHSDILLIKVFCPLSWQGGRSGRFKGVGGWHCFPGFWGHYWWYAICFIPIQATPLLGLISRMRKAYNHAWFLMQHCNIFAFQLLVVHSSSTICSGKIAIYAVTCKLNASVKTFFFFFLPVDDIGWEAGNTHTLNGSGKIVSKQSVPT